jgi:hypothetical protein
MAMQATALVHVRGEMIELKEKLRIAVETNELLKAAHEKTIMHHTAVVISHITSNNNAGVTPTEDECAFGNAAALIYQEEMDKMRETRDEVKAQYKVIASLSRQLEEANAVCKQEPDVGKLREARDNLRASEIELCAARAEVSKQRLENASLVCQAERDKNNISYITMMAQRNVYNHRQRVKTDKILTKEVRAQVQRIKELEAALAEHTHAENSQGVKRKSDEPQEPATRHIKLEE